LIGLTNQRGERYELRRDPLGRIVEEVDYWGQPRQYRYDAAGRLRETIDPLGQHIRFETDELGRIVKKTFDDIARPGRQEQERFAYDKRGLLKEMRNRNRQVKRTYDAAGRLTEEDQDGFKVGYRYDEVGNRVERSTSAGNKVVCAYDLRNQVATIAVNDEAPIAIERDALGRTTKEQLGEHVARQFEYDQRNLLTAQTVLKDAAPLFETRYDYDTTGNLTRRSDSEQGEDHYEYDVLGRLLAHTDPQGKIAQFLNDPAGDRLRTRIKQTQLKKVVNGNEEDDVLWTREGTYEGVHYVFDRAGNLVYRGDPDDRAANDNLELIWDANQRLAESRKSGEVTKYGYDPLGRRVFKRNPTHTTWFYWDGDALLGEVQ
jgi:YD repeat-containing protein